MTLDIIPVARRRSYPPRISKFTQPFWSGLAEGRWQTTCCEACGKFTFPPKPICPHCWSGQMAWKDFSARGTLYSWTRVHSIDLPVRKLSRTGARNALFAKIWEWQFMQVFVGGMPANDESSTEVWQ